METTVIEDKEELTEAPGATEDQQNAEPYVPPKRGVGRPPKNPNKIAVTLPKPPSFQLKKPQTFIEYWKSLNKVQATTCLIRVYRLWPIINNKQIKPDANNDIDTIVGEECFFGAPDDWEDSLLHRYGSGWYQLYLNQEGSCICRCIMKTRQDMANHPPKLVAGTLLEGHPDNAGYVQYLRDRGLYKDERLEAQDMQTGETINRLSDKLIDMATRQQIPLPPPPNNDRVITELVRPMMTMMGEANKSAIETVKAQTSGNDPLASIAAIGAILKELKGGGDDSNKVMMQETMQTNRMLLEKLLTRDTPAAKSGMDSFKETLDIIKAIKELNGPSDKNNDDEDKPGKESVGETLLKSLPTLAPVMLQLVDRGLTAWNMFRQPVVTQPMQPPQQMQPPTQPVNQMTPTQMQAAAQQQAANPTQPFNTNNSSGESVTHPATTQATQVPINPATGQPYTTEELQQWQESQQRYRQYHEFIQSITQPLLNHLNDTNPDTDERKNGYDFADWFISGNGRVMYDTIKGVGTETLMGAFQSYTPLWQQIGGIEAKVKQFVEEFMTYDEYLASEAEGEQTDE